MDRSIVFKTRQQQLLEHRLEQPLEDFLQRRYDAGATQAQIAGELGVNFSTVSRWMAQFGITARITVGQKAASA